MNQPSRIARLRHASLLAYAAFCLLLPAAFIGLHIATPSDGARLSRQDPIFTRQGAVVSPYRQGSGPLQEGDMVTAVNGVSLLTWAQGLVSPADDRPFWQAESSAQYTVRRDGQVFELAVPLTRLPLGAILSENWSLFVFFLSAQALAGFVYWKKPDDPAARAFFIWAFSGSHTYTWAFFLQLSDILNPISFWLFHLAASGLWMVFWAAVAHMYLVFPRPIFHFSRSLRWIFLVYLSPFVIFAAYLIWTWQTSANVLEWLDTWGSGQVLIAIVYILPGLLFVGIQYFTARTGIERLRTRWVTFGTLLSLGLGVSLYFVPSLLGSPLLSPNALGLINFPFLITMTIAILRYRLFDIDIIIRRTLVYSLLTLMLGLVYFSLVTALQNLFSSISQQQSPLSVVLSTLAIATLSNPLRRRIQDFIDRRFFRRKYDADKALAEFAAAARSEADLHALTESLVRVVRDTVQPKEVSIWLKQNR